MNNKTARCRTYASIACTSCKRRKTKCNQHVPCSKCSRLGLNCVYEPRKDGRRKEFHQLVFQELQIKDLEREALLDVFRTADENSVSALVQAIRCGSSIVEAIAIVHPMGSIQGKEKDLRRLNGMHNVASASHAKDVIQNSQDIVQHRATSKEYQTPQYMQSKWSSCSSSEDTVSPERFDQPLLMSLNPLVSDRTTVNDKRYRREATPEEEEQMKEGKVNFNPFVNTYTSAMTKPSVQNASAPYDNKTLNTYPHLQEYLNLVDSLDLN